MWPLCWVARRPPDPLLGREGAQRGPEALEGATQGSLCPREAPEQRHWGRPQRDPLAPEEKPGKAQEGKRGQQRASRGPAGAALDL